MIIVHRDYPWEYVGIKELFSIREIRTISHHIDLVSKTGSIDITNAYEGPFKLLRERVYELINQREIKKKFNISEPLNISITLIKPSDGLKIVTPNKKCMMFYNIKPFKERDDFILLDNGDHSMGKTISEGIMMKSNGTDKKYKFLKPNELIILSVQISNNKNTGSIPPIDNRYENNTITGGALIYKDDFAIITKFKCGSSTIEKWFSNSNQKKEFINNIRYETYIEEGKINNVKNKIFIIRNPYERFFSGLLQTRIYGSYDVYKQRRTKQGAYYTIPFNNLTNEEILKTLKLSIRYNPSFIYDKHIQPYMEEYLSFCKKIEFNGCKIIHLDDLTNILNDINNQYQLNTEVVKIDMRGELYDQLNQTEILHNFYELLKNSNDEEIKLLIEILDRENQSYNELLKWT